MRMSLYGGNVECELKSELVEGDLENCNIIKDIAYQINKIGELWWLEG